MMPAGTSVMILGLCALAVPPAPGASTDREHPIDLDVARQYFDEARSISERDGGELWGVELHGPLIFADRATRFVVANRADAEGHLRAEADVFIGTLPESETIANTGTRWAGVEWTMVMWPLPGDEGVRGQLLAHEMYHRIQDDLDLRPGACDNRHLDERDGRLWMRLEWRALRAALESDGAARRQAIEDALRFRAVRQSTYPDRADDERILELNEGLSEYTGVKAGWPTREARFRAAIDALIRADQHPNFVRSFAYTSGPAYGLLIDEVDDGSWRRGLSATSDFGVILARAYGVDAPGGLETAAMERLSPYDGAAVIAEEDDRLQAYHDQQLAFAQRFEIDPVLVLPITDTFNFSFDPNAVKSFGEKGSVYLTARVVGDWGVLEVASGGALFVTRDNAFTSIVVPAPTDLEATPVRGDGYSLSLNDGWAIRREGEKGDSAVRRE